MATLALSRDLLNDYAKLEKRTRSRVSELADMFQRMTTGELRGAKGINLEPHKNAADPRARTVRIDDNHRGIVLDLGDDQHFVLTRIGTHDAADRWMRHNVFRVNEATGALEIRDVEAINAELERVPEPEPAEPLLFAHRKDKEFVQLGVGSELLPALRAFTNEDQLQAFCMALPQTQADALIMLTGPESVDVLYGELVGAAVSDQPVDIDDLVAALTAPASRNLFHVVADEDELTEMLAQPLAQWRTYLHHTQRDAAYRPVYNGPVRVTGGAGTGKTVVAIHRAKALADQLEDRSGKPILFTTFTRNLAQAIERDLRLLDSDVLEVVDVLNVDRFAYRVVQDAEDASPKVADDRELNRLFEETVDLTGSEYSADFLRNEWEQVILAQGCDSRAEYFQASRAGRGIRLDRRGRAAVWAAIEELTQLMVERGCRSHLQLSAAGAGYLDARTVKPYQHVIVDEAQDLHESQWRLLRAAVPEGQNDMFIVGDSHQRIYDRRASLAKVGINIRGRSRRLRINYRTTHEILRWAMALLGEGTYDDLDEGVEVDDSAGYHSLTHGPVPTMAGFGSTKEQYDALVARLRQWRDDGVEEDDLAVAARSSVPLDALAAALRAGGLEVCELGSELVAASGIQLGTMHRMKGLEFRCVAVVDVDDDSVPAHWAMTDKQADEVQHRLDLIRERCVLYVACTRARDDLWVGWSGKPSRFLGPMLDPPQAR